MIASATNRVGVCARCAAPFERGHHRQRHCPDHLRSRNGTKPPLLRSPVYFPTCRVCGAVFSARRANVSHCREEACVKAVRGKRAAGAPGSRPSPRTCPECGSIFTWLRPGRKTFCAFECARRWNIRSKAPTRFYPKVSLRNFVYERDGLTCHLCFMLAVLPARPGDPWAATLDHLVPRSAGGGDSADNLRTCHRWCNTLRGARPLRRRQKRYAPPPSTWDRDLFQARSAELKLSARTGLERGTLALW